jgi:hypothetical protein
MDKNSLIFPLEMSMHTWLWLSLLTDFVIDGVLCVFRFLQPVHKCDMSLTDLLGEIVTEFADWFCDRWCALCVQVPWAGSQVWHEPDWPARGDCDWVCCLILWWMCFVCSSSLSLLIDFVIDGVLCVFRFLEPVHKCDMSLTDLLGEIVTEFAAWFCDGCALCVQVPSAGLQVWHEPHWLARGKVWLSLLMDFVTDGVLCVFRFLQPVHKCDMSLTDLLGEKCDWVCWWILWLMVCFVCSGSFSRFTSVTWAWLTC